MSDEDVKKWSFLGGKRDHRLQVGGTSISTYLSAPCYRDHRLQVGGTSISTYLSSPLFRPTDFRLVVLGFRAKRYPGNDVARVRLKLRYHRAEFSGLWR